MLLTFKYNRELSESITDYTFRITLILKKFKYFMSAYIDAQLIESNNQTMEDKRNTQFSNLFQNIMGYFKRKDSIISTAFN